MKLITKAVRIELTSEERNIIENLANNCENICSSYSYACSDCPFQDFCSCNYYTPHHVLALLLNELTKE